MRKRYHILYTALILSLLLGIQDGYVALWKDQAKDPVYVFPYKAQLLPQEDQLKLEQGIPIRDLDELEEILEDYLS